MKYGIRWYAGIGEHGYEQCGFSEHDSLQGLFDGLMKGAGAYGESDDLLFDALDYGRQDTIYWITDDFGFELYRPS